MPDARTTAFDIDLYHIDAAYLAWKSGYNAPSAFELFTRGTPFRGGYMLTAGLEPAAEFIGNFRFTREQLAWLRTIKPYEDEFFEMLAAPV